MDNLFFTALVSFAISEADNAFLPDFQRRIASLLADLKEKEWEDIQWVEPFLEYLQVDSDDLPEVIAEFMDSLSEYSVEELVQEASDIRIAFFLESAPKLGQAVKTIQCTYTIQWQDGSVLDYICKPFGFNPSVDLSEIAKFCGVFLDQFIEASIQPGLDHFYQNAAQVLDDKKLEELLDILYERVNDMPLSERLPYERLINRIEHRLLQKLEFEPPSLGGLVYFKGKGGFK